MKGAIKIRDSFRSVRYSQLVALYQNCTGGNFKQFEEGGQVTETESLGFSSNPRPYQTVGSLFCNSL